MKFLITGIILYLSFGCLSAQEHFIQHNGYNRTYLLYVPSNYDGSSPYSLMIALHSSGGTDSSLYPSGFNERAEIMKFIAVYPRGIDKGWSGPDDDVDFISVLIDTIKAKYNIDSKRVYAAGQSAGAFLSYRLAAQLPEKIAAIAPLAGAVNGPEAASPVPVCAIHAVNDELVPYSSALASVDTWRQVNGCTAIPDTIYNQGGVIGQLWKAEETGADVVLYTYAAGGHSWLNSPVNCVDLMMGFFYSHPKRKNKVTLTSPEQINFDAPANIDLTAAVESNVSVQKIEYFANSIKLGESSEPPYLIHWKNIPQDEYLIYSKAAFTDGTSEISSNLKQINVILPNIAIHKPFECSGNESNLFTAQNAFDGDLSTRWSTPFSDPQWISVDLQETYQVSSVTLFWETACALEYSIDVSSDNQNWTSVYSTSEGKGGTENISFTPVEARYVRMYGTRRATPYGYSLWEFQVHGTQVTSVSDSVGTDSTLNMSIAPNPFNSETTIDYTIPKDGFVELIIYNIAGQKICTLVSAKKIAGKHTLHWNSRNDSGDLVSSGVYISRLNTNDRSISSKLILLK